MSLTVEQLTAQVDELTAQVAELTARLGTKFGRAEASTRLLALEERIAAALGTLETALERFKALESRQRLLALKIDTLHA